MSTGPDHDRTAALATPWRGKFIEVRTRGRWEFAGRIDDVHAAVVLALDGDAVLLVEQDRVPLGQRCLELPAGLVDAGETPLVAAGRELAEETGYRAAHLEMLGEFCSSPGMVSERFTLVRATGLTRNGNGGGLEDEDIVVHRVAMTEAPAFIAARRAAGVAIDVKLLLLLASGYLASAT